MPYASEESAKSECSYLDSIYHSFAFRSRHRLCYGYQDTFVAVVDEFDVGACRTGQRRVDDGHERQRGDDSDGHSRHREARADFYRDHDRDSEQISTGITTETASRSQPGSRQRQRADLNRDHDRDSEQISTGITTETASRSQPGSRQRQRADLKHCSNCRRHGLGAAAEPLNFLVQLRHRNVWLDITQA